MALHAFQHLLDGTEFGMYRWQANYFMTAFKVNVVHRVLCFWLILLADAQHVRPLVQVRKGSLQCSSHFLSRRGGAETFLCQLAVVWRAV